MNEPTTPTAALRAEAEQLAFSLMGDPSCNDSPEVLRRFTEEILRFAQAREAAVWREAQRKLQTPLDGGGHHISDFAAWDYFDAKARECEAHAKEKETT